VWIEGAIAPTGKMSTGEKAGTDVFVKDKQYGWLPARLLETKGDKAEISLAQYSNEGDIQIGGKDCPKWVDKTISLKDYKESGGTLPLQNKVVLEDMVDLPFLHEAAILYNIKARHQEALPYTRTGDIVIAVNPYQWLLYLYEEPEQLRYANTLVWEKHDSDPRKLVPPHVYETSSLCYKGLAQDHINQSILVSGESGAGKTETVKICMTHMASLQRGPIKATGEAYKSAVVGRVMDSNPLLEGFGNAKTRRNDNSSRFGKYIKLQFKRNPPAKGSDVDLCALAGSIADVYLLEKSRICGHDPIEGAYHIFYYILNSPDDVREKIWHKLKGSKCEDFKYVGKLEYERHVDGNSDADNYTETLKALEMVHVKDEKLKTLTDALCIVLALGNLAFGEDPKDEERSLCTTPKELGDVVELLGVPPADLEKAFTEKTQKLRGESIKVQLKFVSAKEGCDAFAKEIYARAFLWLVREINCATSAEDNFEGGGQTDFGILGLLDIFGFESFPLNGFEQLCINYCNEKLQQKFTTDIFQTVQDEYRFEGIRLDNISFDDNSDVLDLIEGRGGLLATLNEESIRPKGSDSSFVTKACGGNKKSKVLLKTMKMGPFEFGLHHYAGKVNYSADGFLSRNADTLPPDIVLAAKLSTNEIIRDHLQNDAMQKSSMKKNESTSTEKGPPKRGKSSLSANTVWTKFKVQLNSLMAGLSLTRSRYIRCVKPNTLKKKLLMEHETTIGQLRCAGVVAAITISRSAYPSRMPHEDCWNKFKAIAKKIPDSADLKENLVALIEDALPEKDGEKVWAIGKTRIYFRMGVLERLEGERAKQLSKWAIPIQRIARGFVVRKKLGTKLMPKGPVATIIQTWVRGINARKVFAKLMKKHAKAIKKRKKQGKAATKIQAIGRGFIIRPKFQAMMNEQRDKIRLKNEVLELEAKAREAEMNRMKELDEAKESAEKEIEEYKTIVREKIMNDKKKQKKAKQIQTLIDESAKIIEYLRKENMKLRGQNESMRKDFKSLKENNARLMEANASASASFTALNDHAKQLNVTNAKLIKNVEAYKGQLEKLKEDLKTRQSYYLAEAEARLAYQKTMAQVVGIMQDQCKDAQLVEDVVIMALECESEAKSDKAAVKAGAKKKAAPPKKKIVAPPPDYDDSDDDSD